MKRPKTKKLIPNKEQWVNCPHRELDHWTIQALTGLELFRQYTLRSMKIEDSTCMHGDKTDSSEYTILECSIWEQEKYEVTLIAGKG